MSEITLRLEATTTDLEVSSLVLRSPLRGAWQGTATCYTDVLPLPGDAASFRFAVEEGVEDVWTGTVLRARAVPESTTVSVTLCGGAGTLLSPPIAPRFHTADEQTVPAGLVAQGIATDAGETLAEGVETALDAYRLSSWMRMGGKAIDAVDTLAGMLGLGWRVGKDGLLWMGAEAWPDVSEEEMGRAYFETGDPADGEVVYACQGTPFEAGESVAGAHAVEVLYRYDAMTRDRSGGSLRAEVRVAVEGDPTYAPDLTLYRQPYAGTVMAESTDGLLEVAADDPRVGVDLRNVPARTCWPGCAMTVPEGTRVRMLFESGAPTGLFAMSAIDADAGAVLPFALKDDESDCGTLSAVVSIAALNTATAVLFTYAGPFSNAFAASSVDLTGKIVGPCHAYAKGKPGS